MTTPDTFEDRGDDASSEEPSGALAEALAGVAAMLSGVATEEKESEEAPPEEAVVEETTDEAAPESVDDSVEEAAEEPDEAPQAAEDLEVAEAAEAAEAAEDTVEAEATPADVEATAADVDAEEAEEVEEDEEELLPPASPYDLPGSWYVVHSYSGYENKVKANLSTRIKSMHMEDAIFDIVIPMEDVVEIKAGRKVTVPRKQFPGYILVRMYMDDDSWGVVRNTPGVTGFVGSGTKPTPLSRREVERILGVRKDEEKKAPRFKPDWEVGETVRVIDGPFADFNGVIEDINVDQSKVRVLVDIFGRETPVELNFEQIQKF